MAKLASRGRSPCNEKRRLHRQEDAPGYRGSFLDTRWRMGPLREHVAFTGFVSTGTSARWREPAGPLPVTNGP